MYILSKRKLYTYLSPQTITLLKLSVFFIFLGLFLQYIFWKIPLADVLVTKDLMEPIVSKVSSLTWNEYLESDFVGKASAIYPMVVGWIFLILAFISVLLNHRSSRGSSFLIFGTLLILLHLLILYLSSDLAWHLFFKNATMFATPLLLNAALFSNMRDRRFIGWVRVVLAVTFIFHGINAIGFFQIPESYLYMIEQTLFLDHQTATQFLFVIGVIDIIVGVFVLIPMKIKFFLYYMVFWGLMTALARPVAYFDGSEFFPAMASSFYDFLVRLPNVILPLMIISLQRYYKRRFLR